MNIISWEFAVFTLAVLILYYLLPRQKQNGLLLAASYLFFISISWHFTLLLLVMTLGNYILGRKLFKALRKNTKIWLHLGIAFNLVIWSFFKMAHFFVPEILKLIVNAGLPIRTEGLRILLPVGLSFYTLQAISYLIDLYQKQIPNPVNLLDFAVYLAYFPKLTAGPIERPGAFLAQLQKQRQVDNDLIARSFNLLIMGLFRKLVIADTLFQAIPQSLFNKLQDLSAGEITIWVIAFAIAVYYDFCGYTNIVRGISGFFGINLSRNFAHPLFARNFSEFWSRWHITLSSWLRDYIYYPISRALVRRNPNLKNIANMFIPALITMTASAIWHSPQLGFIAWGVFGGCILAWERIRSALRPVKPPGQRAIIIQVLLMFKIFILGLFIPLVLILMFSTPVKSLNSLIINFPGQFPNLRIFLLLIPGFWLDIMQYRKKNEHFILFWPILVRSILLALAILLIFLFSQGEISDPFIYQGF